MQFAQQFVDLSQPKVMGILNVTPDSFSDGGRFAHVDAALRHAEQMLAEGADIIDVGGESTRPGAPDVDEQHELQRVIPVIEALQRQLGCLISVDTSKASVMTEAVKAGAVLINDVRALREPGALQAAASAAVPVCLMHMQGQPRSMQRDPHYDDVVEDIKQFLIERVQQCEQAGIPRQQILLDPGFGFGKNLSQNYQLLARLKGFQTLGMPVLVGVSRKSMLGEVINKPVDQRLAASIAAATIACLHGAQILRVHDVAATADAVKIITMMNQHLRD